MRQFVQAGLFAFADTESVIRADLDLTPKSVGVAASPASPDRQGGDVGRERGLEPVRLLDGKDISRAMSMAYAAVGQDQHRAGQLADWQAGRQLGVVRRLLQLRHLHRLYHIVTLTPNLVTAQRRVLGYLGIAAATRRVGGMRLDGGFQEFYEDNYGQIVCSPAGLGHPAARSAAHRAGRGRVRSRSGRARRRRDPDGPLDRGPEMVSAPSLVGRSPAADAGAGAAPYYVAVSSDGSSAGVWDAATGKELAAIAAPTEPSGDGGRSATIFSSIAAAGDDRTFVLGAIAKTNSSTAVPVWMFELRLGASGSPGPLRPLSFPRRSRARSAAGTRAFRPGCLTQPHGCHNMATMRLLYVMGVRDGVS